MPRIRLRIDPRIQSSILGAIGRLEISFDLRLGIKRARAIEWDTTKAAKYGFLLALALASLYTMAHSLLIKLGLVGLYTLALLVPFTSQFFVPATPVFSWLLLFYSSQFLNKAHRPHIWVSVLPTLESILYGANISDLLTRNTNAFLDILAWIPYGVIHFAGPFITAAIIWVFGPPGAVKFFGAAFGYMNLIGVMTQVAFPCAPPWYELREGLVPANYNMRGSAGGLARIDQIFGGHGYENTFGGAPVPFGAFPSLHAGCSTMDALMLAHFFPRGVVFYYIYLFWLYWSTMYLTHHYLIDLVAGGSLTVVCFYYFMPDELRNVNAPATVNTNVPLDLERNRSNGFGGWDTEFGSDDGDEVPPQTASSLLRETGADLSNGRIAPFEAIKGVKDAV